MMARIIRFILFIPRRVLIGIMHVYRFLISPLYGNVCRFYPSCSAYCVEALHKHGAIRGVFLTARRLLRCNPWNAGGYDPVPEHQHANTHRGAYQKG